MKTVKPKKDHCLFYIVRHGETEWNINGIIQGHQDSPLTEKGIEQAKKARNNLKNISFDEIFSSDLLRAKRTAEIIALEKKMMVKTSKLLRERFLGRFQGKKYQEFKEELKDQLEKMEKLALNDRLKFKLDREIESDGELTTRFILFLRQTAVAYRNKRILVVTHGGVMRTFLIRLGWAENNELPVGSINNLSCLVIESDGVDFFVRESFGIKKLSE